jgi:ribonuclease P protein component
VGKTSFDAGALVDALGSPSSLSIQTGSLPRRRCKRLRRDIEFERVRREGQSWSSPLLVLQVAAGPPEDVRLGMVATKRLGNAVKRNRVRRLIRESMLRLCPLVRTGSDLVVIARSRMVDASFDQVRLALSDVLSRAGLIRGPSEEDSSADGLQF